MRDKLCEPEGHLLKRKASRNSLGLGSQYAARTFHLVTFALGSITATLLAFSAPVSAKKQENSNSLPKEFYTQHYPCQAATGVQCIYPEED